MRSLLFALALAIPLAAQPKPIAPADYAKWETLGNGVFSPNGKWLAYPIRRADGTFELRISPTAGGKTQIAKHATDPAFSADSRWIAYSIGVSEADAEKAPAARKPQNKLGLMDLVTGTATTVDDITQFAFSDRGAFLALRRYAPRAAAAAPAAAAPAAGRGGRGGGGGRGGSNDAVGTTLFVRDLASGIDTTFGNVTDFKWQDKGTNLAMTIGVENRVGNGIQLYDAAARTINVLDSGDASFSNLVWRKDSADLAALRSKRDRLYEGDSFALLAWTNLTNKKTADVPAPQRIVSSRAPQWSEDGKIVYLGIAEWDKRVESIPGDPANVEIWHSKDVNVWAEQKLRAARDRDRHVVAAWHLDSGKIVPLGTSVKETMQMPKHGQIAIALDETPYETDGMFGRRYNDIYKVDLSTSSRSAIAKRVIPPVWHSPSGHYVLAFKDNEYTIYDLETGATRNLSKLTPGVTFTDKEDDHTAPHKPSWGIAGWTSNDKSVIVYDDTDLYELASDGSFAHKLTNGSAEQVRYRYVNVASEGGGGRGGRGGGNDEAIDLSKPVYLSLYGIWTKKTGYAIMNGANVDKTVWLDKGVSQLIKAKDADAYAYVAQSFDSSPNYFAAKSDLKDPLQVSDTNPFQSNYAWGKAQLIDYKSPKGERLQGALFYPANYQPGKQYPMLVHIYERESNFLHRYFPVSERTPYSEAIWTAQGYFVLMPDIVFRPRDPGLSILECTVAATKAAVATGMIDAKRMGITGHSWGGYGSTFIMTQTDMFAAGAVGGSLTDLISNFGEVYWNNGVPETGHMEVGQERMEVPLWEDQQAYIRNSAVFSVNKMKGPLLMSTADKDGASDWHQTLEFYNIARRAGKQVVMLMYPGENHSLAIKANQIDYHHRILDWFGYYLKGNDAPTWINKGESVIDREKELKRMKKETEGAAETGGVGAP